MKPQISIAATACIITAIALIASTSTAASWQTGPPSAELNQKYGYLMQPKREILKVKSTKSSSGGIRNMDGNMWEPLLTANRSNNVLTLVMENTEPGQHYVIFTRTNFTDSPFGVTWELASQVITAEDYSIEFQGLLMSEPERYFSPRRVEAIDFYPKVKIIEPVAGGDSLSGKIKIKVEASDNFGIDALKLRVDYDLYDWDLKTNGLYEFTVDTRHLHNCYPTFHVIAQNHGIPGTGIEYLENIASVNVQIYNQIFIDRPVREVSTPSSSVAFNYHTEYQTAYKWRVYDESRRLIKESSGYAPGGYEVPVVWDMTDTNNNPVAWGVYRAEFEPIPSPSSGPTTEYYTMCGSSTKLTGGGIQSVNSPLFPPAPPPRNYPTNTQSAKVASEESETTVPVLFYIGGNLTPYWRTTHVLWGRRNSMTMEQGDIELTAYIAYSIYYANTYGSHSGTFNVYNYGASDWKTKYWLDDEFSKKTDFFDIINISNVHRFFWIGHGGGKHFGAGGSCYEDAALLQNPITASSIAAFLGNSVDTKTNGMAYVKGGHLFDYVNMNGCGSGGGFSMANAFGIFTILNYKHPNVAARAFLGWRALFVSGDIHTTASAAVIDYTGSWTDIYGFGVPISDAVAYAEQEAVNNGNAYVNPGDIIIIGSPDLLFTGEKWGAP
jgi:hypothetical protein